MRRRCRRSLGLLLTTAIVVTARVASAQTATQVVNFAVTPVNQIGISGSPSPLVISTATAGSQPASATAGGTSYSITTNQVNQKITASIDQAMPGGLTLEVQLAAPAGATSAGNVSLGTSASDVVTGISSLNASALPISYRLSAAATANVSGPASRTVTFTIVAGI